MVFQAQHWRFGLSTWQSVSEPMVSPCTGQSYVWARLVQPEKPTPGRIGNAYLFFTKDIKPICPQPESTTKS